MGAFLHRHWLAVSAYLVVLILAGFVGWGYGVGWQASAWGALAQLFAGLLTVAAVAVALREATQGGRDRLVDYEAGRRRECVKALGDLWGAIMQVGLEAHNFEFYLNGLQDEFDANGPRLLANPQGMYVDSIADEYSRQLQRFVDRWVTAVEPHIFISHSLLEDTPLKAGINDVQKDLDRINNEVLPKISKTVLSGRKPDVKVFHDAWTTLVKRRQAHLDLAREYFGLSLEEVEAAALGHGRHAPRALTARREHQEPATSPETDNESDSQPGQPAS